MKMGSMILEDIQTPGQIDTAERSAFLPDRPPFYGPHQDRELVGICVLLSEIITHEKPKRSRVLELVQQIKSGAKLPPVEIDPV